METLMCLHCGRLNESDAGDCRHCASPLPRGERHRHSTVDDYAPPPQEFVPPFESAGDVLRPTMRLYKENFGLVAKIVLVAAVPLALVEFVMTYGPSPFLVVPYLLLNGLLEALMAGALTYAVYAFAQYGISPTLKESYKAGFGKWLRVVVTNLVVGILVSLASLALVVPGLILSMVFSLVVPLVVIENRGVGEALSGSAAMTKGYRWRIFFTYSAAGLVLMLMTLLLTGSSGNLFGDGPTRGPGLVSVLSSLTLYLLQSVIIVLSVFIYLGIHARSLSRPHSYIFDAAEER